MEKKNNKYDRKKLARRSINSAHSTSTRIIFELNITQYHTCWNRQPISDIHLALKPRKIAHMYNAYTKKGRTHTRSSFYLFFPQAICGNEKLYFKLKPTRYQLQFILARTCVSRSILFVKFYQREHYQGGGIKQHERQRKIAARLKRIFRGTKIQSIILSYTRIYLRVAHETLWAFNNKKK